MSSIPKSPFPPPELFVESIRNVNRKAVALMRGSEAVRYARPSLFSEACEGARQLLLNALCTLNSVEALLVSQYGTNSDDFVSVSDSARKIGTTSIQRLLALTFNNLACVYRRAGQEEQALEYLQRAAEAEQNYQGVPTVSTLLNVTVILTALGKPDDAISIAKGAVGRLRSVDTSDETDANPCLLLPTALHNYAIAQQQSKRAHERRHAAATMAEALIESRKLLGEDHPTTIIIRKKCGLAPAHSKDNVVQLAHKPSPPSTAQNVNYGSTFRETKQQGVLEPKEQARRALITAFSGSDHTKALRDALNRELDEVAVFVAEAEGQHSPVSGATRQADEQIAANEPKERCLNSLLHDEEAAYSTPRAKEPKKNAQKLLYRSIPVDIQPNAFFDRASVEDETISFRRFMPPLIEAAQESGPATTMGDLCRDLGKEVTNYTLYSKSLELFGAHPPKSKNDGVAGIASIERPRLFANAVLRRIQQAEREQRAEKKLAESRKKHAERLRYEAEQRQCARRLAEARRIAAAAHIQKAWRCWWKTVGLTKRHKAELRSAEKKQWRLADVVVCCARLWLERSCGRRYVLKNFRKDSSTTYETLITKVVKIQCAWRSWKARYATQQLIAERKVFAKHSVNAENLFYSALVIQSWWRKISAHARVCMIHTEWRDSHARDIQRVARRWLKGRKNIIAERRHNEWLNRGAVEIQRCWRGFLGRVTAAARRVRARIEAIRTADTELAVTLQRAGRGFLTRQKLKKQAELQRKQVIFRPVLSPTPAPLLSASEITKRAYLESVEQRLNECPELLTNIENESVRYGRELYLDEAERQYKENTARYVYALTATQIDKLRSVEADVRASELEAFRSNRAARVIQRAFRHWQHLLWAVQGVRERRLYYQGRMLKENNKIKTVIQREQWERQYNRQFLMDLSKQVREEKKRWEAIDGDLTSGASILQNPPDHANGDGGSKFHEEKDSLIFLGGNAPSDDYMNMTEARSVWVRSRDAKLCTGIEREYESRKKREQSDLRKLENPGSLPLYQDTLFVKNVFF